MLPLMRSRNSASVRRGLAVRSAVAMLQEVRSGIPSHVTASLTVPPQLTAPEIRERMSGNICRCGAYSNIVEAITEIAGRRA